jgi:hypothetical protein
MRDGNDFRGMTCAIAARIRLLPAASGADAGTAGAGAAALSDECVSFVPVDNTPPKHRLADLFDIGTGSPQPISLGRDPGVPFVVEVSLYAPGSLPCRDNQPLVGLGRSGVVDLRTQTAPVTVPIGCRDACETHDGNVQVQLLSMEDMPMMTVVNTPQDLALGEIFPYETFTATSGVCMDPRPLSVHRGVFRPFALTQSGPILDGTWVVDHSQFDGCTAIAGTTNGGRQLSCLFDENTSKTTLQGFVLDGPHLQAVRDFNDSVHARAGALVIRVLDPADMDPNGSAIGARVNYTLLSTQSEAEYPQDDTWMINPPTPVGTTGLGLGVAVIANAPTGQYQVTFSDGITTRVINAGGADDPQSVTVVVVSAP